MSQNTKKVLFTSHTANFSKFNRPFMRWFKEHGYEVHYASAGEEEVFDTDKHFNISFERSPFKLNNLRAIRQLKKIIDTEHYNIIHTHTPMGSVVTRLAALQARKLGTRVIYTAHGFHFYKGASLLNWIIYYPIEKIMARFTDTLITINQEDFIRSSKSFKTSTKYVQGVGVDPKKFDISISVQEKVKLRKSLNFKKTDFVLLYTAELSKRKNQLWLINTLANFIKDHKDVHLLLPGQDSLRNACQELAIKLDLDTQVHFLGYRNDIPQIMKVVDIAVSSSRQEGLPMNIIEAMYLGLPVVVTDCRGNHDLVKDERGGFVTPQGDSHLFVRRINEIYQSKKLRLRLSKEIKGQVAPYTLSEVTQKMNEIYDNDNKVNEPLRILHIVTSMNRAGLESMIMNYYRNIDRSKVQFDFLMHRAEESNYEEEILKLGGKIYRLPSISVKHIADYPKAARMFFEEHPEYQIIHAHMDALSALPLSAAKKAGVATRIAHSHNNSFDIDIKYPMRVLAKQFITCSATNLYSCSTEAGLFMFGNKLDYTVINNAINVTDFRYNPALRSKIRRDLKIENRLVVGHVGRFSNQKNHDFLVDIFYELTKTRKDALLVLVGTGENESKIKYKVQELGIEKNVRFLGSRSDVSDLMQSMDVFVMPSLYEGLPVVSIEAQATGLPCVYSDVITKELDVAGISKFISLNEKPESWAQAIIESSELRRKDSTKIMRKSGYDVKVQAKDLEAIYLDSTKRESHA